MKIKKKTYFTKSNASHLQIDVVKSVMYEIKEIVLTSGTGVLEFKIQYCTVCICICMLCVCVCTCVCVCLKEHLSWLCT